MEVLSWVSNLDSYGLATANKMQIQCIDRKQEQPAVNIVESFDAGRT